jgi:hypothetical protein
MLSSTLRRLYQMPVIRTKYKTCCAICRMNTEANGILSALVENTSLRDIFGISSLSKHKPSNSISTSSPLSPDNALYAASLPTFFNNHRGDSGNDLIKSNWSRDGTIVRRKRYLQYSLRYSPATCEKRLPRTMESCAKLPYLLL